MPATVRKKGRRPTPAPPLKGRVKPPGHVRRNSTVSRWGNSLGLRIPQEAADQLNLKAGERVSVEVRTGVILVKPLRERPKWSEADLLKGVTPDMVGGEVNWGRAVGKEAW